GGRRSLRRGADRRPEHHHDHRREDSRSAGAERQRGESGRHGASRQPWNHRDDEGRRRVACRNGEERRDHRARRGDRQVGERREAGRERAGPRGDLRKRLRRAAALTLAALLLLAVTWPTLAQSYPSRSIRLVVDTSPGGLTDIL